MQITIEVPDSLAAIAATRGISPEAYAADVVGRSVAHEDGTDLTRKSRMNLQDFLRVFPIRDRESPGLSHDDLRRENLYDDRC